MALLYVKGLLQLVSISQAMKSEIENSTGQDISADRKTPSSSLPKSVTPSGPPTTAQPCTLPSPSSSPVPEQLVKKAGSSWQQGQKSSDGQGHMSHTGSDNAVKNALSNKLRGSKNAQVKTDSSGSKHIENCGKVLNSVGTNERKGAKNINAVDTNIRKSSKISNKHDGITKQQTSVKGKEQCFDAKNVKENVIMETDSGKEMKGYEEMEVKEIDLTGAHTPGNEMETDQALNSYVRKIDFDLIRQTSAGSSSTVQSQPVTACLNNLLSTTVAGETTQKVNSASNSRSSDVLSKSTGFITFQQLLKEQNEGKHNLNKSMGFLENSATSVRSAFVPVQSISRKDGASNQSVAMAIPVIIPSSVTSQATACVLPATALFSANGNSASAAIPGSASVTSTHNPAKQSIEVVTVTSALSKMPTNDIVISSAQNSQALARQTRSKFTPIRPKASPSKASPAKENKGETGQSYDKDKRPVAAILKEKRAKEQAEAVAKQTSLTLQTIQLPPTVPLPTSQLSAMPNVSATSTGLSNEVVIIVNNQPFVECPGGALVSQATVAKSNLLLATQSNNSARDKTARNLNEQTEADLSLYQTCSEGNRVKSVKFLTGNTESETKSSFQASLEKDQLSPMDDISGDITPILEERDSTPEMDLTSNTTDRRGTLHYPMQLGEENTADIKDDTTSSWIETPSKIAKLNINSPFRPDSSCSLGRETPVKITKSESSQSRPESACSYGRETPSGARKRKSSESQARRDIKRLNSTGEEMEDISNLVSGLSPETDVTSVRRTRSCTYELEKSGKTKSQLQNIHSQHQQTFQPASQNMPPKKSAITLQGLQSPDINCLEREALIESFPNSLLSMKPGRSSRTQSVGVSARSLKHSQQKLKSQQEDLDQRVRNYFQTKGETTSEQTAVSVSSDTVMHTNVRVSSTLQPIQSGRSSLNLESQVVTDRGKPYVRPASVITVSHSSNLNIEPSGLPSDVADWITESLEKRQKENHLLLGNQSGRAECGRNVENFQFEMSGKLLSAERNGTQFSQNLSQIPQESKRPTTAKKKDENMFMVPKAPPIPNQRQKDHVIRLGTDHLPNNQRCQSLPIFASPAQSPVSPAASPIGGIHGYQRALSMSPRGQAMDVGSDILSPVSSLSPGILSPDRRKEPVELFQHPALTLGQSGIPSRDQSGNKVGPYLKSIQQSLQKPGDHLPRQTPPMVRESAPDKQLMTLPLGQVHFQGQGHVQFGTGQNPQLQSRESSLEVEERYVSQTPFSDSGYQSSGTSPILNSTPVSTNDSAESGNGLIKHSVAESPVTMVTDFTSPIPNITSHIRSPIRQQLTGNQVPVSMVSMATSNLSVNGNLLSSIHSAFTPIQGSHDVRYVAPIKPTVTLPNSVNQEHSGRYSTNLFIETNDQMMSSDISMISPHSSDPPSYEVAIQQLHGVGYAGDSNSANTVHNVEMNMNKPDVFQSKSSSVNRLPLDNSNNLGPFAAKLKMLSQQTSSSDIDSSEILLNLLSPTSESVAITTTALTYIPGSELPVMSANLNSVFLNQNEAGKLKPGHENSFTLDSSNSSGSVLLYSSCVNSNQRINSQNVLDNNSAKNITQSSYHLGNSPSSSVLNIDPSFHLPPSSANRNPENIVMSSLANENDSLLMVDVQDDSQAALGDNPDIFRDLALNIDSYLSGTVDGQDLGPFDILM